MKTVYILTGTTPYDGNKTFGVFSSRKIAEKVFADYMKDAETDMDKWNFEDSWIQEVSIDTPIDFN